MALVTAVCARSQLVWRSAGLSCAYNNFSLPGKLLVLPSSCGAQLSSRFWLSVGEAATADDKNAAAEEDDDDDDSGVVGAVVVVGPLLLASGHRQPLMVADW